MRETKVTHKIQWTLKLTFTFSKNDKERKLDQFYQKKKIRSLLKSAEKLNEVLWESVFTKYQQDVIKNIKNKNQGSYVWFCWYIIF